MASSSQAETPEKAGRVGFLRGHFVEESISSFDRDLGASTMKPCGPVIMLRVRYVQRGRAIVRPHVSCSVTLLPQRSDDLLRTAC